MKVLMIARNTLYSSPGGDSVQIEMTAKYLRALGVKVDIRLADQTIDHNTFDIIHFFNIIRPDDIICHIKKEIPYVVSTIFVDFSEYDKQLRRGVSGFVFRILNLWQIEYLKSIARLVVKGDKIKSPYYIFKGQRKSIIHIAKNAKLLLPNSHSEYKRLENKLGYAFPYSKIVNAIDPVVFNDTIKACGKYKDHILCVGRIEGRKNQLNLINAIVGTKYKLTIIGKPAPNQSSYYQKCCQAASASPNITFIDHIDHEQLVGIYKAAKVHVLASWFETTGLSSLEAAIMECNVVITSKGDTEEYFGNMAYYCDPNSIKSIQDAINRAYQEPTNMFLKNHIIQNYTWSKSAEQTLNAYQKVLASQSINPLIK